MKQPIITDKAPAAGGPYTAGILSGDFVFVSGQGPFDPQTKAMPDNIEDQTKRTLDNVKGVLEAAGASMADVVKVTVLLTDVADFQAMNRIYETYFPKPFPARTTFGVSLAVPNMKIEIDAIAEIKK